MSISQVVVPVPVSGDGPLVDVSSLVGRKTVVLTGSFQGIYDLLVSHDDVRFVSALQFDAGGVEGIRQTISGAFRSVRLRAATPGTIPISAVTCDVSAVAAAGENSFATIASLAAGFSGAAPIVDVAPLFPPTGPEEDICIICRGNLVGLLVVEGSLDGSRWCPIGSFRVDRLPEGSPTVLEFPVLSTEDKTRYVRVTVSGTVGIGGLVVTMGGRVLARTASPTGPAGGVLSGSYPDPTLAYGSTGAGKLLRDTGAQVVDMSIGTSAAPTALLHLGAGAAAVGKAPLKITAGILLALAEAGAVESDGTHLYWTNELGVRTNLDGGGTLAQTYSLGASAGDQTISLLDAKGGGVVVNGAGAFAGANSLRITGPGASVVSFPRVGGLQVVQNLTVAVPTALTAWKALDLQPSTLTLTAGGVAPTSLSAAYFAAPVITQTAGTVYTLPTVATVTIEGPPTVGAGGGAIPVLKTSLALEVRTGDILVSSGAIAIANQATNLTLIDTDYGVSETPLLVQYSSISSFGLAFNATGPNNSGPTFNFIKSRSLTGAAPDAVHNGDTLGYLGFAGDNGVDLYTGVGASIEVRVDGAPGAGAMPATISFATASPGSVVPTTRMRITSSGNVVLASSVAAGANASLNLVMHNSATAPTASVDLAHLYCADIAAGRATLAIYTEEAVAADVGLVSTSSLTILLNGVPHKLMLAPAAP
jgi:hypothetical protein